MTSQPIMENISQLWILNTSCNNPQNVSLLRCQLHNARQRWSIEKNEMFVCEYCLLQHKTNVKG